MRPWKTDPTVAKKVLAGISATEVARQHGISPETVATYTFNYVIELPGANLADMIVLLRQPGMGKIGAARAYAHRIQAVIARFPDMPKYQVQTIIGRGAIACPSAGRVFPFGSGFEFRPDAEHLKHRAAYSTQDANDVADWLNGQDRELPLVARAVDHWDPVNRQGMRDGWVMVVTYPRRGLVPLPDRE